MLPLLPLLAGAAMFFALVCFWLAWTRLSDWAPTTARRRSSDYGDTEQAQDRAAFGLVQNWRWTDSEGHRRTEINVIYEDAAGIEHRATVTRYVRRGDILDGYFPVWYNRADPNRASTMGPLSFLLIGLLAVVAVAQLFRMAIAPGV